MTMPHTRAAGTYLTLMSILFGLLISVWVASFTDRFKEHAPLQAPDQSQVQSPDLSQEQAHGQSQVQESNAEKSQLKYLLRGILVLSTLVCLWWWYAIFLGRVAPTTGFFTYGLDFLTIAAFASGAALWHDRRYYALAVTIASVLMGLRLWRAVLNSKDARDRHAALCVIVVLGIGAIGLCLMLLGAMLSGSLRSLGILERFLWLWVYVIPLGGILVTVIGVWLTEGLSLPLGRTASGRSRLGFIPSKPRPNKVAAEDLETLRLCVDSQRHEMHDQLMFHGLLPLGDVHLSRVHSEGDASVQAMLACLPSIRYPDEIKKKCLAAYFCHWLDDVCDSKIVPRSMLRSFIAQEHWREGRLFDKTHPNCKRIAKLYEHMSARLGTGDGHFDSGMRRVVLGTYIFADDKRNHDNRMKKTMRAEHVNHLRARLGDEYDRILSDLGGFAQRFALKSSVDDLVHLTTKSLQELWIGLEGWNASPALMFCYDLLYAPALYLHDCSPEEYWGELGTNCQIDARDAEKIVRCAGELLVRRFKLGDTDERLKLRIWQIRSMLLSFAAVLPDDVQRAYRDVADLLDKRPTP